MTEVDLNIIEGCIHGKRHAQNKLFKRYAPILLGICMRYARNKTEAEDILQESFIKIYSGISGFRGEGSFEGWLKRIVVNTAITHNKQFFKHYFHSDIEEIDETQIEHEEQTKELPLVKIPQARLMAMIQKLPEGYRTVFNLYVFEQYSHQEIADFMGISVNTSKSQLMKARRVLIKQINQIIENKDFSED
ncbi:MAG TPA: RNA polymerase sigma factor [Bacteroidales bacterium]|nr:RNA polymerase sigma factor [Bacteroidales bacterium]